MKLKDLPQYLLNIIEQYIDNDLNYNELFEDRLDVWNASHTDKEILGILKVLNEFNDCYNQ